MVRLTLFAFAAALVGCAATSSPLRPQSVQHAEQEYRTCLRTAAHQLADLPVSAQEIVATAEGRCYNQYVRYRDVMYDTNARDATTAEEMQLAHDKTHAQLRLIQADLRSSIRQGVAVHALTAGDDAPVGAMR